MRISIHSRKSIDQLFEKGFPENTAVISFYDPIIQKLDNNYSPVDYTNKTDTVFQVALEDIEFAAIDEAMDYDDYFPEADNLAEFILNAYRKDMNIICQCDYGQSRSAGCAAAIMQYFYGNGIIIFADSRYCPNQMVFNKVLDALIEKENKNEN